MKAYISCSLAEPINTIGNLRNKLKELGYEVTFYKRGTDYSDKDLKASDIVVLVDQEGSRIEHLTRGCRQEITIARDMGKSIYLYRNLKDIRMLDRPDLLEGRIATTDNTHIKKVESVVNTYQLY